MNNGNLFINQGVNKGKAKNNIKPDILEAGRKKPPSSRSSSSTATTSTCDQTYSSPTRTCTDSLCTDIYSETTYTVTTSSKTPESSFLAPKSAVSALPNPYSEIPTLRPNPRNFKPSLGPRRDTDLSTSSCTTCTGTYSLRTCSHCASDTTTERESTITEESSNWDNSSNSTRSSDSRITEKPLLGRQVISSIDRNNTKSSMTTLRASSRPDLSTNRSLVDYFRGSGQPTLTPSRSNPSIGLTPSRSNPAIYQQPPSQPVPVPPPRVPSDTPLVEKYDHEPGRVRRPSWHSTQPPKSPNFQYGDIPVYNADLKLTFSHSPVSGRSQISIPSFTSPGGPSQPGRSPGGPQSGRAFADSHQPSRSSGGHGRTFVDPPQPSRSLVDLYGKSRRNKSGGSTAMETSM